MAEEKDTKIKITDRRKFNPDGSLREQLEEPGAPQAEAAQPASQTASQAEQTSGDADARSNVVSFSAEAAKKKDGPQQQASPQPAAAQDQAGAEQSGRQSSQSAQAQAAAKAAEQAYNQMKPASMPGTPEASFLGLLDMLAGEAAMCLGMVKNPSGAEIPTDLDAARQIIDMLGMLQQKTSGNLNAEEKDVLENILAYLRMQYVALSRNK